MHSPRALFLKFGILLPVGQWVFDKSIYLTFLRFNI